MANIPLTYKISWYNPAYPGGQIHTQNDNMNHTTSASTQYTMQDIIDTVAYDAGSVERDGTPIAGYISQWTSPDKIKGQTVSAVAGMPVYGLAGGFTSAYNTSFNSDTSSMILSGFPMDVSALDVEWRPDYFNNFILDPANRENFTAVVPSQFNSNLYMGSGAVNALTNASTYHRKNTIIGMEGTCTHGAGNNHQGMTVIGANIDWMGGDFGNSAHSAVIIGASAFESGSAENMQYGVFIGREMLYSGGTSGMNNVAIGGSNVAGNFLKGQNSVLIGSATGYYYDANATAADGDQNTMVGYGAGRYYRTGAYNTFMGAYSGPISYDGTNAGSNNTCLGYQANVSTGAVSNEVVLGNASVTVLRCQQNTITALSDERDKKDIIDLDKGLDTVMALKPRKFVWDPRQVEVANETTVEDEDGHATLSGDPIMVTPSIAGVKDVGFIAQELQDVDDDFLRLVYAVNPDKLEASYGRLVPVLVKAIQELSAKVTALESA
tara:strand:+ start:50 stop:1531 length:1482 start_codon:yes stop_codon:yes gene_type:complete